MQHRRPEDDSLPRVPAALRTALWQERQQQHHFVRLVVMGTCGRACPVGTFEAKRCTLDELRIECAAGAAGIPKVLQGLRVCACPLAGPLP